MVYGYDESDRDVLERIEATIASLGRSCPKELVAEAKMMRAAYGAQEEAGYAEEWRKHTKTQNIMKDFYAKNPRSGGGGGGRGQYGGGGRSGGGHSGGRSGGGRSGGGRSGGGDTQSRLADLDDDDDTPPMPRAAGSQQQRGGGGPSRGGRSQGPPELDDDEIDQLIARGKARQGGGRSGGGRNPYER
ncbi:hypothetical protein M7I_5698 [Glarea lozoyensis 74030]|uniref:Uncharacterized protein n=1 Tax=Glarea lozoyensis (strain ATCC 74030 / MF5533) TaxID=1104152 RepID=H0ESK5_GLAL7|nr:hypothetical protein M7I_5698 [Glarea lozoyensis 74030]